MSNQLDGLSCSAAAAALGLSPLATQAMRVGLMLLKWSTRGMSARFRVVFTTSSSGTSILVSRRRVSNSGPRKPRQKSLPLSGGQASSSTGITAMGTEAPLVDVL